MDAIELGIMRPYVTQMDVRRQKDLTKRISRRLKRQQLRIESNQISGDRTSIQHLESAQLNTPRVRTMFGGSENLFGSVQHDDLLLFVLLTGRSPLDSFPGIRALWIAEP